MSEVGKAWPKLESRPQSFGYDGNTGQEREVMCSMGKMAVGEICPTHQSPQMIPLQASDVGHRTTGFGFSTSMA